MSTLRSRAIRLAHSNPELQPLLLPILAEDRVAAGKKPVKNDIRHPYYDAGDKIGALRTAVETDPNTKGDKALLKAVADLQKAHDAVAQALKPYSWD